MEKELKQIWTKELCQIEANKYKNRTDLKVYSKKVYSISCENNWLDEFYPNMVRMSKWTKELCQIEANKYKSRNEFKRNMSGAYKFAKRNNCLDEICKHMIILRIEWTKELCQIEANKYKSRNEFKTNAPGAYKFAKRNNYLDEVCQHMIILRIEWTKELCQIEANKYESRSEFKINSPGAYKFAKRNNLDEVCQHMMISKSKWEKDLHKIETSEIKHNSDGIENKNLEEIYQTMLVRKEKLSKWSKELCQIEADKYKRKTEFRNLSGGAYLYARKKGWIDEICKHMISSNKISMPQLILSDILSQLIIGELRYNDRKTIKPKELDIYFPDYKLAFEYNGKRWHKSEKAIKRDIEKLEICKKLGIHVIIIDEYDRYYAKYEENLKKQLIKHLELINKITNLNITKDNILKVIVSDKVFDFTLDFNDIKEICDKYTDYTKFMSDEKTIYRILKKYKKIEEFTSHMKRHSIVRSTSGIPVKIEIDNVIYISIRYASIILNITENTIRNRCRDSNFPNYKII